MLDEYTARNNNALKSLIEEHGVQLRRLPDDVLLALWQGTQQVMDKLVATDPMAAKVYDSYSAFYNGVRNYHHISEQSYINTPGPCARRRGLLASIRPASVYC